MFWDKISPLYDLFENLYNRKVYHTMGLRVAEEINGDDVVLECACGTGAISVHIAEKCRLLFATDLSAVMRRSTFGKCHGMRNVVVRKADIMGIHCRDNTFDKVVAGNVIHLIDHPVDAVNELLRVCKPGGKVNIPTYINNEGKKRKAVKLLELMGADFKRQFDLAGYSEFFRSNGFQNTDIYVVSGRMPCAIAVVTKPETAAVQEISQENK